MFRTLETDQAGITGMFGDGLAHWHAVSRVLGSHWYHVTIEITCEGNPTEVVLLINDERRLQAAYNYQDDEALITDVQVVTPAYMNGGKGWRMEPLKRVSLGENQDECSVCVIEVESGAVYHDSHCEGFDCSSLTNLREIYHSPSSNRA